MTDLLILGALSSGRSYGYELVERLTAAGLSDLNEATVYGALRRLEAAGLLTSVVVTVTGGPARRYYDVNEAGRATHDEAVAGWREFVSTVESIVGHRPAQRKARVS